MFEIPIQNRQSPQLVIVYNSRQINPNVKRTGRDACGAMAKNYRL